MCLTQTSVRGGSFQSAVMLRLFWKVFPTRTIFICSLEMSIFPDEWKVAKVVPTFKKEDRELVGNNRPVSLLPSQGSFLRKLFMQVYQTSLMTRIPCQLSGRFS